MIKSVGNDRKWLIYLCTKNSQELSKKKNRKRDLMWLSEVEGEGESEEGGQKIQTSSHKINKY